MESPPPARRALKRSASTASLLTPPRTYRRRGRGRSRGSCDSDSDHGDLDNAHSSDDDATRDSHRKKRKLENAPSDELEAEAKFWGGGEACKSDDVPKPSTSRPTKPLVYQRFRTQPASSTSEQGLVSPPPSHRKTGTAPPIPTSPSPATTVSLPVTPKPKSKRRDKALGSAVPFVDSPSNPFAPTPVDGVADVESPSDLALGNQSPTPVYDKPTVTYVFRGVRRVYQNPAFNHSKNRPLSPPPNSKLPVEDPNFSPDPTCRPRLLFPEAHKKRKSKKSAPGQSGSKRRGRAWDSDEETETIEQTLSKGRVKIAKKGVTLEDEFKKAAAKIQTDDPFC